MSTKKEAYLCLSAMVRAKEPKLLNADRANRMLEAATYEEAAKLLTDSGYDDMSQMTTKGIEAYLTQRREDCFAELEKSAPDKAIFDVFKLKYDYHNAKVMIKAKATGQDAKRLMSASGRFDPDTLLNIFSEDLLSRLPETFGTAIAPQLAIIGIQTGVVGVGDQIASSADLPLLRRLGRANREMYLIAAVVQTAGRGVKGQAIASAHVVHGKKLIKEEL